MQSYKKIYKEAHICLGWFAEKNNEMSCQNVQAPELERPLSEMQMIDTAALNFLNINKIKLLWSAYHSTKYKPPFLCFCPLAHAHIWDIA